MELKDKNGKDFFWTHVGPDHAVGMMHKSKPETIKYFKSIKHIIDTKLQDADDWTINAMYELLSTDANSVNSTKHYFPDFEYDEQDSDILDEPKGTYECIYTNYKQQKHDKNYRKKHLFFINTPILNSETGAYIQKLYKYDLSVKDDLEDDMTLYHLREADDFDLLDEVNNLLKALKTTNKIHKIR